ncbi:hypothetical protein [Sphaerisporangium siamense]|uniref:Uncharacterized protein n=1 Tax=Sphaerisporangium siamense TaxID=795645 RepID=A0A7W7GAY7_9ACTN|nr:hypothetical protein [Sphaerisporangium siamense]MBB4701904.1 hypothetical protein [Sphaerisporangium siamense]
MESLTGDLTLTEPREIAMHEDAIEIFVASVVYGDALQTFLGADGVDFRKLGPSQRSNAFMHGDLETYELEAMALLGAFDAWLPLPLKMDLRS